MGKAKKLKELRKLERQEKISKEKQKKKKFLGIGIAVIVICLAVFSVYSLIKNNSEGNFGENSGVSEIQKEKVAVLETNLGTIKFKMFYKDAPKTCANFERLTEKKFYDGIKFHRVIKDFMIQTGDPNSRDDDWSDDGTGGPGYKFEDEINEHKLVRGAVAMANSGPNTNGSQFFIVTAKETPWLDGKHTVFGKVIEGMDIVDKIGNSETNENDHPLKDIVMEKVYIEDNL